LGVCTALNILTGHVTSNLINKGSGYDKANQTHRPLHQSQRQLHHHQLPKRIRCRRLRAGFQRELDQRQVRVQDPGRVEGRCAGLGVDAKILIQRDLGSLTHMVFIQ